MFWLSKYSFFVFKKLLFNLLNIGAKKYWIQASSLSVFFCFTVLNNCNSGMKLKKKKLSFNKNKGSYKTDSISRN